MKEEQLIKEVCEKFDIKGEYRYYEVVESGHINSTYRVVYLRHGDLKDYILQRINTYVFTNPIEVMENISSVTEYIRAKIKERQTTAKRNVLHYATTDDGAYYTTMPDGSFWRCCRYIEDSVCFESTENLYVLEESGKAFGEFQLYLTDFPVSSLHIVIPHFHNTVNRYELFREAIEKNEAGRKEAVNELIQAYLDLEELATKPYRLQKTGILPLRVTHNDTKLSNVLFDAKTLTHLSVIDLDTVMPGLVAFDFGDAIRVAGSTAAEDERDLSKVGLDLEKYEAITRGFVTTTANSLTDAEKGSLALGVIAMTVECGVRFLTDYLNGDKYFKIHYPDQNLVRAKCQLALGKDMVANLEKMQAIVKKYC